MSSKKKEKGGDVPNPLLRLTKASVLQDCRIFNSPNISTTRLLSEINKLFIVINRGEEFTQQEATDVFFSLTKYIGTKDRKLRRAIYLGLSELAPFAQDVFMATQSLTKDVVDTKLPSELRAPALRTLIRITSPEFASHVERILRDCMVSEDRFMVTAAVTSAYLMFQHSPDVVKRCVTEVQSALQSRNDEQVRYHAMALYHLIKEKDTRSLEKLIVELAPNSSSTPFIVLYLFELVKSVLPSMDPSDTTPKSPMSVIRKFVLESSQSVAPILSTEASRILFTTPFKQSIKTNHFELAIQQAGSLLNHDRSSLRLAALRTLIQAAQFDNKLRFPHTKIEVCIRDKNKTVASLAVTLLLQIGNADSLDRLLRNLSSILADITEDFKVIIANALVSLCIKFPAKARKVTTFMAQLLHEDGGREFKESLVSGLLNLATTLPDLKDRVLAHLCEYIEDCEFSAVSIRIIHFLGDVGPAMANPFRIIRHAYNRLQLEGPSVRAAAVSCLGKFLLHPGVANDTIASLLSRALTDDDDEVRDRAARLLAVFHTQGPSAEALKEAFTEPFPLSPTELDAALNNQRAPTADLQRPFCMAQALRLTSMQRQEAKTLAAASPKPQTSTGPSAAASPLVPTPVSTVASAVELEVLKNIPGCENLGKCFNSLVPVPLTENDTEFIIECQRHIFQNHIAFQFTCTSTLDDICLLDANIEMEWTGDEDGFTLVGSLPIPKLVYNQPDSSWVVFSKPSHCYPSGFLACTLVYKAADVDPNTGEMEGDEEDVYDETYCIEDVEVIVGDFVSTIPSYDWKKWHETVEHHSAEADYALAGVKSSKDAHDVMADMLHMHSDSQTKSQSRMCGRIAGKDVFLQADYTQQDGVLHMKVTVDCEDAEIAEALASSVV